MRWIKTVVAGLWVLSMAACGVGGGDLVAKIDFSAEQYPETVSTVSGLSNVTEFGRWSDANLDRSIRIQFASPLPTKFSILLRGKTLLKSDEARLKVGSSEHKFTLDDDFGYAEVFVDNPDAASTIEIIPDNPTAPKELNMNEDTRKLGLLLSTLAVYAVD